MPISFIFTAATKLGQGYIFTGVCDSVHEGGAYCTEICALWEEVYLTILFWKCLWFLENVMKYLVNYRF